MGRKRVTKVTDKKDWKQLAVEAAATGATVTECAAAASMSRMTLYRHLESDELFRRAFDDAIEQGTDVIEAEAQRRAVEGVAEPVIYQGKPTLIGYDANDKPCDPDAECCVRREFFTVRKPSDVLAIFLLKGRRPSKFRDNVDVTSNGKSITLAPIKLDGDRDLDPLAERNTVKANGNGHNGNGKH